MNPKMQEIYEKYNNGDSLTDFEVKAGVIFFSDLERSLTSLGPVFKLAAKEARRVAYSFEGFQKSREEK